MSNPTKVSEILAQHPEWVDGGGMADPLYVGQYQGSDESAANAIWSFAMGYAASSPVDRVYWTFGPGSHYAALNTAQALGLQPLDPPEPFMPPAYRAEDAMALANLGWRFDGKSAFLDLATDYGKTEFARRSDFAKVLPPSWVGCDPLIYRYLVLEGTVRSQPPDLGTRPDVEWRNWYGFKFQQYLDNRWAQIEGKPAPWKKGGVPA